MYKNQWIKYFTLKVYIKLDIKKCQSIMTFVAWKVRLRHNL
jgi:hypothetical protein